MARLPWQFRYQIFLIVNGIHPLENLKLDELAPKKVYEFALGDAAPENSGWKGIHRITGRHPLGRRAANA